MTGSRVGLGSLAAGWLWALAVAPGCYAPQIDNGSIGCADGGICPRGFACGVNRRCWRPPAAGGEELTDGGDGVDRPANGDGNDAGSGGKGAGAAGGPGEGGGSGAGVAGVGGTSGTGAGAAGAGGTSGTGGGSGGGGSTGAAGRGVAGSMAGAGGASGGGGGFGGRGSGGSTAGGSGGGAGAGGAVGRGGGSMAGAGGGSMAGTGGGSMAGAGGGSAPDAAVDAPPDAAKKPLGAPCAAGAECGSQLCVDGVCCDGACMGSCEACDTAAATGHCAAVSSGAPHGARAACAGTGTCSGACAAASRTACTYPGSSVTCRPQGCTGNTLTPAAFCDGAGSCPGAASRPCDGDLVCNNGGTACLSACRADADCLAPTPYCQASTCTAARPDGVTCASDGQCQGGRCIDGVCCDRPCTDQCQACDVAGHAGTCWPIPSQEPPHGQRGACSGTGACAGFCDGSSTQCAYPGSETACPCAVLAGTCNGAGQCALLGSLCL